jgi:thiol-disulfide isomerase/thioredoxin
MVGTDKMEGNAMRHEWRKIFCLGLLGAIGLLGCQESSGLTNKEAPPAGSAKAVGSVSTPGTASSNLSAGDVGKETQAASPSLELLDWGTIERRMKEFGEKIVVVDFWSTSCPPCMKEYPELLRLQKDFPELVQCVAVNLDYLGLEDKPPEKYLPKIEKFLAQHQPAIPNWISTTPDAEVLKALESSSLPSILVLDAKQQRVAMITEEVAGEDGFSYASDVRPLVESLAKGLKALQGSGRDK